MPLSPEQQAFLDHDPSMHGRMLAGPGTGKSFTSVQYLERLATDHPDLRVRMLTFTRAATAEFAGKMGDADLSGLGVSPPSTVHGFALQILMGTQGMSLPSPLRIPDTWEGKELIRPHLSRLLKAAGHDEATPTVVDRLEREMSAGWESLDPDDDLYAEMNPALGAAYVGTWHWHRRVFGYVLLGELPYQAGLALEDHGPGAIDLDLLLVDEYQDLNEADLKLVRLVADAGANVLAIGDDDQSIYGFRMAAPHGIRRFLDDYATDCDYPLSESRRCGRNLLTPAVTVIESEPGRPVKPRLSPAAGSPDGTYAYLRFPTAAAEVKGVARIVRARFDAGVELSKIAVLVRSNVHYWADQLRAELEPTGIEVASTEWVTDALTEPEVRRGLALAHLSVHREDSLAWWTVLHLTPGVGPAFVDYVIDHLDADETFGSALLRLFADGFTSSGASGGRAALVVQATLAELDQLETEHAVLDARGWGGWLLDRLDPEELSEEARRLFEMVGEAVSPDDGMQGFLSQLEPLGKDLAANTAAGVRMMTMAQSKGLTVDTAVVMGVEEGIIPFPRGDYDEERRLLYVAMTRATAMCILTWAARRTGPSARFGSPSVNRSRNRCPLLANLPGPVGRPLDGEAFVAAM